MLHDGSACTQATSTTAAVCGFSLLTLSAGPLGDPSNVPDIVQNGAVNGDTISTMSRKAASLPNALQRTVTGVMNRTEISGARAIQDRRHVRSWFFEEKRAIGEWSAVAIAIGSYILVRLKNAGDILVVSATTRPSDVGWVWTAEQVRATAESQDCP
jgi:hypothetical protein